MKIVSIKKSTIGLVVGAAMATFGSSAAYAVPGYLTDSS